MKSILRLSAAAILIFPLTAPAVHVAGNAPNNTAPPDNPGFANIGTLNGASAVYLGGGWVITASHVGVNTVTFGGVPYAPVPGSSVQLSNQGTPGMSPNADIILFQLMASPPLPDLTIRASTPDAGDEVVMIGNGFNQNDDRTSWNVTKGPNPSDDVWTASQTGTVDTFGSPGGQTIRWGTNNIDSFADIDDSFGTVRSLITVFNDDLLNRPDEAQAVLGDSGSAMFLKNGSAWDLAGLTFAVGSLDNYDNIPGGPTTSILDSSLTFAADLSFYRAEILSIIPEPGTAALTGAGLLALLPRRRRRAVRS